MTSTVIKNNGNIKKLIFQFENVFTGIPYFGAPLLTAIGNITYDKSNNSINNGNTIAQILKHIITWRNYAIEHVKGNSEYDIKIGSDTDWSRITINNQQEWEDLIQLFKDSQTTIIQLVNNKQDDWLSSKLKGKEFSFNYMLKGIIQHDIYHFGQINLLKNV